MKTRKIAAVVLCVLSVVAIFCFRLISAPLTGAVTAAELGSALGALSLLPTVLSVALAFLLGDVVVSLLIGLSVGELMLLLLTGEKGAAQLPQIVPSVIDELVGVASDTENTKVLILCALVGGLVGVLMKTGGFEAAAKRITKKVKTPRGANLLGQLFCVLFFFDDYANALITGPVLRPIADKVGLSRERLAYIVDSTAAPVAGIAVVSSWVAVEIAVISSGLGNGPVSQTLPFRFSFALSPIASTAFFALVFMLITSFTGREFGPMLKAGAAPEPRKAAHVRIALNRTARIRAQKSGSDLGSFRQHRSARAVFCRFASRKTRRYDHTAASLGISQRHCRHGPSRSNEILPAGEGIKAWLDGVGNIVPTIIVLLLAWSLASIVEKLGTVYISSWRRSLRRPHGSLFRRSSSFAAVSCLFAAGSYGCMFMVMPMAIPIACAVMENSPGIGSHFLPVCVAGVLSGGIFGDHCSPMTDCTILAALGSGCDVMDHAVTQMPYAFTVALVSIFCIISQLSASAPYIRSRWGY